MADSSSPWSALAAGYEQARAKADSLDTLVEWPAQRALLGDVDGLSILDVGCGSGSKLAALMADGARDCVGLDLSGNFIADRPSGLELVQGDISELATIPAVAARRFDRITFLQSIGYAKDPVDTLCTARSLLADDGFVVVTRTQPIRYAVERAEQNSTSLGEEYFTRRPFSFRHRAWNDGVELTKKPYTISDLLNLFSAAGFWIEETQEPQLSPEDAERYPHKQEWLNKHLGILMFKLRPRQA